jgi:hypothetical protein
LFTFSRNGRRSAGKDQELTRKRSRKKRLGTTESPTNFMVNKISLFYLPVCWRPFVLTLDCGNTSVTPGISAVSAVVSSAENRRFGARPVGSHGAPGPHQTADSEAAGALVHPAFHHARYLALPAV